MKNLLIILLVVAFVGCTGDIKQEQQVDYTAVNDEEINSYLEKNNLKATKTASGLYYIINKEGTGAQPTATSTVRVAYKGYFPDKEDNPFDRSNADGISFGLQQVIAGWTEGITYFKEGGSGVLLIPSHLGYGPNGTRGIPGGAVLLFDITLLEVQ